jgi:hypothetical protein
VMNESGQCKGKGKISSAMTRVDDEDAEFLQAQRTALAAGSTVDTIPTITTLSKKGPSSNVKSHEELTMSLLRELPQLLLSFKSEASILQHLTTLPRYLCKYKSRRFIETYDAFVLVTLISRFSSISFA